MIKDFQKFAQDRKGISSLKLDGYAGFSAAYINPTIIEERHLNVASMDVFSRLMMDRIIFLGVPINDDVANIIQAQLLYLESADPEADIQLYINSPGGQVYAGWGIYDTMNLHNLHRNGGLNGSRPSGGRCKGTQECSSSFEDYDTPADGRYFRPGFRH